MLALPAARNLYAVQLHGPCAASGPAQSACDDAAPQHTPAFAAARSAAFLLAPQGAGTFSYYLRTQSTLPQNPSLSLSSFAAYDAARQTRWLVYGMGCGLMAGLVLFAVLLRLTFRERVYLRFMLNLAAAAPVSQQRRMPRWVDIATIPLRFFR